MTTSIRILLLFCLSSTSVRAANERLLNTTGEGLEVRERYRRLIPYMTFYVSQGNSPQAYYQTGQQYRPIVAISNKIEHSGGRFTPYLIPVIPQQQQHQQQPQRYIVQQQQQPSHLTKMITQNYLAIAAKQATAPLQDRFNINNFKPVSQPQQVDPIVQVQPPKQLIQPQQLPRKQYFLQNFQPARSYARPPQVNDMVTITQSQEIPVEQPTVKPQDQTPVYESVQQEPLYQQDQVQPFIPQPPIYQKPEQQQPNYPDALSYHTQEAYDEPEEEESEDDQENDFNTILEGYQLSKALPERITSENLDSSIKTLSKLLRILQKAHALPQSAKQLVKSFPKNDGSFAAKAKELAKKIPPLQQEGSTPGKPGIDYPNLTDIPPTHFNCKDQRYKGFFGDPETGCQVWHYCDLNGGQASFLCPNGTIFSQVALTCDWWFNVKCSSTAQLYVLNERLYKYILPQKPSFPEDFSGPLVDRYLSLKFQELERNRTEEALKKEANEEKDDSSEKDDEPTAD